MKEAATGLRTLVPSIDVLAASPLTRAQQTARIVAKEYDGLDVGTTSSLEPDSELEAFAEWLRARRADVVAVVGHEPHLGMLVESRVPLRKGAACLLEFRSRPAPAKARLHWALTASQLGRLTDH